MIDYHTTYSKNIFTKLNRLINKVNPGRAIAPKDLCAVKIHFGEYGNTAYINPIFLRPFIERIKKLGAKAFLTDTNTLYVGKRTNAVDHLINATQNGFAYAVTGTPVIIADGLKGDSDSTVSLNDYNNCNLTQAYIGNEILNADSMIVLSHFKGHELACFGGTLKNLGMGCASRRGKLQMHSSSAPKVDEDKCVRCAKCISWCNFNAISLSDSSAIINNELCSGCADCIAVCPEEAINIIWNQGAENVQKLIAEYAAAAVANKKAKVIYFNFIKDVTPACDCFPSSDIPFVEDIGIVASTDPVAIDQASADLVNSWPDNNKQRDRLLELRPKCDWTVQLKHAEAIGLGSRDYELIKLNH